MGNGAGSFQVSKAYVTLTGFSYTVGAPLIESRLIANITEPANTELDLQGRARLYFSVRPLRYKPYLNASYWLEDGTDGGLVIGFGRHMHATDSNTNTSALQQMPDAQGSFPWYTCSLCLNQSSQDNESMPGPILVHRTDWQGQADARVTDLSLAFAQSGANGDFSDKALYFVCFVGCKRGRHAAACASIRAVGQRMHIDRLACDLPQVWSSLR